jgi:hypothetical protein
VKAKDALDSEKRSGRGSSGRSKYTGYDAKTNTAFNTETGRRELIPLGVALEEQQAESEEEERKTEEKAKRQAINKIMKFTDTADSALEILENKSAGSLTGPSGEAASWWAGSDRKQLEGFLTTLKGTIGFDTLQAMRDASPTGGALGQVSERELAQLNAYLGSLELKNFKSAATFAAHLKKVRRRYIEMTGAAPLIETQEQYDDLQSGMYYFERETATSKPFLRVKE